MQPRHAAGRPPSAPNGHSQPPPSDGNSGDLQPQHPQRSDLQETHVSSIPARHAAPPRHSHEQSKSYQRSRAPLPPLHPNSHPHSSSHAQHGRGAQPPAKGHFSVTVNGNNGPSATSSAPALAAPSAAINRLSLFWVRRRLVLIPALVSIVLIIPLLYLTLTSTFFTSALCSSAVLASSTLRASHFALAPPILLPADNSAASASPYQPHLFTLPSPTQYLFITSHVDPSASLHTQFQQFLYAPYLSLTLNISYVYNGLSKAQGEWGRWLGLDWGERAEDGLLGEWARERVFQYEAGLDGRGVEGMEAKGEVAEWVLDKRRRVDDVNERLLDYSRNKHKLGNAEPPRIDEPKGSHLVGPDTTALNPNSPINTASVLRLSRMPLPALQLACYPPLHLLLRQKYCAARVREPLPFDLYGEDRARGRIIVAVHYRCGDECYHPTRAIPLSSTINTLRRITELAAQHSLPPLALHVFSSPPANDTAESFFHPLTTAFPTTRLHLSAHSHLLLHHLVSSDVLMLPSVASSGLSWLAELLHAGAVTLVQSNPLHDCGGEVSGYRERDGEFDGDSFVRMWQWSVEQGSKRRYDSLLDCYALKPLEPISNNVVANIGS